jgi:hypothetical protein
VAARDHSWQCNGISTNNNFSKPMVFLHNYDKLQPKKGRCGILVISPLEHLNHDEWKLRGKGN